LPESRESEQKIKIAVVPGNIKQANKWKSEKIQDNFLKYFITTQKAAGHQPTMVVWPETAVPVDLIAENSYAQSLRELAHQYNVYLLIGVPHNTNTEGFSEDVKTYNTVFLLSPKGEVLDMYHKTHLVPFGEYIPFKKYLPKKLVDIIIGVGDFEAGKRHTIFSVASAYFGVGICFESVFPEIFRKFAKNGANLMGILTNDAWFEGTAAPRQHYDMAAFRAIENRIAIFRVANGGISAMIDPYGRTISAQITPENPKDEFLIAELPLSSNNSKPTPYTRWGDVLPYACLIVTIALLIWRNVKRKT
jgi:apolipoprotein N-acyltransferase